MKTVGNEKGDGRLSFRPHSRIPNVAGYGLAVGAALLELLLTAPLADPLAEPLAPVEAPLPEVEVAELFAPVLGAAAPVLGAAVLLLGAVVLPEAPDPVFVTAVGALPVVPFVAGVAA